LSAANLNPLFPNDFKYKVLDVEDSIYSDLSQHFEECFQFIEEGKSEGGVLVHCAAGVSRSAAIVCSYLMKSQKISYQKALHKVKQARRICQPNSGFEKQLLDYEKKLFTTN